MESINRNKGLDRVSRTWDGFVGGQGEGKDVKKYDRELRKAYGLDVEDETADFMRDFGRGQN
jgi:hypothetical protein